MKPNLLNTIASLRLLVGYLGEKEQMGWWQSSFFTQGNSAFLNPLFGRTQLLAQCNGVTRAAALVHDDRIGVGHVYHLFRLPEDMEQGLHQALHDPELGRVLPEDANATLVLERLGAFASGADAPGTGPVRVGGNADLGSVDTWKKVAGLYVDAFQQTKEVYPYFTDIA